MSGLVFLDLDDVICLNKPFGGYDVIDGSLPSDKWHELFHAPAVVVLNEIAETLKPQFILTTSWLVFMERPGFEALFGKTGLEAVSKRLHQDGEALPIRGQSRYQAIDRWLIKNHRGEPYVIIDDQLSGTGLAGSRFDVAARVVFCDVDVGLLPEHLPFIRSALTTPIPEEPSGES